MYIPDIVIQLSVLFMIWLAVVLHILYDEDGPYMREVLAEEQRIWNESLQICEEENDITYTKPSALCITYLYHFHPVNIEILSWIPALVIYRNFLPPKYVSDFMEVFRKTRLEPQRIFLKGGSVISPFRVANGSFFHPSETPEVARILEWTKRHIPGINFDVSEELSGLSYKEGGFYKAHYDYLKTLDDPVSKQYGNRMATLIFSLQTAKKGGATVFPYMWRTVFPNPGDAYIWFNVMSDLRREFGGLHGGCPVMEGEKVILTSWIRTKGQPILPLVDAYDSIDAETLIPDNDKPIRSRLRTMSIPEDD